MKKTAWMIGLSTLTLTLGSAAQAQNVTPPATGIPDSGAVTAPSAPLSLPVSGVLTDGGTFSGILTVTKLALDSAGKLVASGNLVGTAVSNIGQPSTPVDQPVTNVPATIHAPAAGSCDILNLKLGSLNLDVLGLVVDLTPLNLDVSALPGPGKLLGDLLCTVAHLLDNPLGGALGGITGALGGLLGGGSGAASPGGAVAPASPLSGLLGLITGLLGGLGG